MCGGGGGGQGDRGRACVNVRARVCVRVCVSLCKYAGAFASLP